MSWLCAVLLLLLGQAQPSEHQRSRISAEQAAAAGRDWLDGLTKLDARKLADRTSFPFTYRSTGRRKLCEGAAVDVKALTTMVGCIRERDKLLADELAHADKLDVKLVEPSKAPAFVRSMIGRPAPDDWLVSSYINGDGITFEFVLVVTPGRAGGAVKSLLVRAEVESGD